MDTVITLLISILAVACIIYVSRSRAKRKEIESSIRDMEIQIAYDNGYIAALTLAIHDRENRDNKQEQVYLNKKRDKVCN